MIVSASYRTDIPAFYGKWFMNRVNAGYCEVKNPYSGKINKVSLLIKDVDAFIFWTKNLAPFYKNLITLNKQGYRFLVHYTINNYQKEIEKNLPLLEKHISCLIRFSKDFGKNSIIWRYDPIVISSITDINWHKENFEKLARKIAGYVDEVIVSFMCFYKKIESRLMMAGDMNNINFYDISIQEKKNLLHNFIEIAKKYSIKVSVCSQPDLTKEDIRPASCINAEKINEIITVPVKIKIVGNRPGCLCQESRDIGSYDSCPIGCIYCYANKSFPFSLENLKNHDPESTMI
ncbi:MAG TPA: DUF1848 domain-containing protein [Gammaproteobacteria bacterium]|nr:DUF1848 domain-containing protein [Gammaproteobacteria bacterium]